MRLNWHLKDFKNEFTKEDIQFSKVGTHLDFSIATTSLGEKFIFLWNQCCQQYRKNYPRPEAIKYPQKILVGFMFSYVDLGTGHVWRARKSFRYCVLTQKKEEEKEAYFIVAFMYVWYYKIQGDASKYAFRV